jgi:hypothetical protein
MHGGRGSGARRGNRNAWKHGYRSASHAAWKRSVVRYLRATEDVVRAARLVLRAQKTGLQFGQAEALLHYGNRTASLALESVEREKEFKNPSEQPHAPGNMGKLRLPSASHAHVRRPRATLRQGHRALGYVTFSE